MILAVVAMFPTSLFIASNYSYDTWVIGFVMIGMAYFVGNCQEEGVVSTKRYGHYGYSICNSNNSKANLFSIFDNSIFDETEQN